MVDPVLPRAVAVIPALSADGSAAAGRRWLGPAPLLAYAIAAARQAACVRRTWVATDDPAVVELAVAWQAEIFHLPAGFDGDARDAARRILDSLADKGETLEPVTLFIPLEAPFRARGLLDQVAQAFAGQNQYRSAITVSRPAQPPAVWAVDGGGITPLSQTTVVQTAHAAAYASADLLAGRNLADAPALAVPVEAETVVDFSTRLGWARAEWLAQQGLPELIYPLHQPRPLPEKISLLVMDFDGVLTDNRVWVAADGSEQIAAYRGDSLGLHHLARRGIQPVVLSMETNPVVAARCQKMKIVFRQGINDKPAVLRDWLAELGIPAGEVIYLGNDINDLPCFSEVGCAVVPADAEPAARQAADLVLTRCGGHGAVRELCDLLLARLSQA